MSIAPAGKAKFKYTDKTHIQTGVKFKDCPISLAPPASLLPMTMVKVFLLKVYISISYPIATYRQTHHKS